MKNSNTQVKTDLWTLAMVQIYSLNALDAGDFTLDSWAQSFIEAFGGWWKKCTMGKGRNKVLLH